MSDPQYVNNYHQTILNEHEMITQQGTVIHTYVPRFQKEKAEWFSGKPTL